MENNTQKALKYISKRLLIISIVAVLSILAFNIAFNQSKVRTFVGDAMEARASTLLTHEDTDSIKKFFDASFLEKNPDFLKNEYQYYHVTGYDYALDINKISVGWISPSKATATASERITNIRGVYTGSEEDKAGKAENPPEWTSAKLKVRMRKYDGRWYITSIEKVKELKN